MKNKHNEPQPCLNFSFLFTTKITNLFITFMKGLFALCVVASLSFLTYSSLSGSTAPSQVKKNIKIDYENVAEFRNVNVVVSPVPFNRKVIRTNLSHIVFGISGTAKTWEDRRYYIESWWRPNVTRGFVWLDKPPATWPTSTSPPYRISGDTERFKYTCSYGSRAAIRIARIVKETFELGLENVRWFVMGDDDTVFFLESLVTVLGKYDHRQMYYIGGNSESTEQNVIHSYITGFGGGGFAISYPLAVELVKFLDGCIDRYAGFYGSDQKIGACMSEIGVSLTKELGFHQVDLKRDIYGFLAAHPIAPLVSLHHLDYVKPIFPGLTQVESIEKLIEAYEMDPGRTLQQSFCYDLTRNWSLSVSWGYTVQIYSYIVTANDLATPLRTFLTWRSYSNGPFAFNTLDFSNNPCERPIIYFLDRVQEKGEDRTMSFYKRYMGSEREKDCKDRKFTGALSIKEIRVSAATFELDMWKKVDLKRDIYGFLAAHPIAPLVSLHHLDYVKPIFPGLTQVESIEKLIEAYEMDPGRTLQQSFCYDLTRNWSLSVSWGYTVQIYSYIVTANDLATPLRTFLTWRSYSNGPFAFNTLDFSNNPCERPIIYFLDRVQEKGEDRTMSFYKRYMGSEREKDCKDRKFTGALSIKEIRVSAATFELDMWKKAPRRQCSEIVSNPTDRKKKRISINIRGCKDFESVTAP